MRQIGFDNDGSLDKGKREQKKKQKHSTRMSSKELLKSKVFSYLNDFPKSTVNDLAGFFCRRGFSRKDLVELIIEWREGTSKLVEEEPKQELVIKENQIVPKDYKKPTQKRICSTCGQKYIRDEFKKVEVCPHCKLPRKTKLSFYGSDFCRMCIPSRTPKKRFLTRSSGNITLLMEAGRAPKIEQGKIVENKDGIVYEDLFLPAGIIPRLILLYISDRYTKTKNREISFGNSLYEFIKLIGRKDSGNHYKIITNQLNRLIRSKIGFFKKTKTGGEEIPPKALTDKITLWWDFEEDKEQLIPSKIILSDSLLEIVRTSVPLDLNIVHNLGANVLAFDIYAWLTARHFNLTTLVVVPWKALHDQFGVNFSLLKQFKYNFKKAFNLVKDYYPHNSTIVINGVLLLPSRTDINPSFLSENKKTYLQNFLNLGST